MSSGQPVDVPSRELSAASQIWKGIAIASVIVGIIVCYFGALFGVAFSLSPRLAGYVGHCAVQAYGGALLITGGVLVLKKRRGYWVIVFAVGIVLFSTGLSLILALMYLGGAPFWMLMADPLSAPRSLRC